MASSVGFLSISRLKTLSDSGVLGKFQFSSSNNCEGCRFSKQIVVPFGSSNHMALEIFDLVHSDIWGPTFISSRSSYNYYVCFVDNCFRCTLVYLMRNRSELLQMYTEFTNMIHTYLHKCIKLFQSDGAREYLLSSMTTLLKSPGTISQQSCPHAYQLNGVVERKYRYILEVTRSRLLSTSVPKCYWA